MVGLGVVVGTLVLVLDDETDGGTEGDTSLDTRLDGDGVGLVTLKGGRKKGSGLYLESPLFSRTDGSGESTLSGATAGHLRLDVGVGEGHTL